MVDKPKPKADEKPQQTSAAPGPAPPAGSVDPQSGATQQRVQVKLDDSKAVACYANFCRVTGTPEEVILDFGLNPQPFGVPADAVIVSQRIITNLYTAKRMLHALQLTVQRHEAAFGVLETDVQKRVLRTARAPAATPPA